MHFLMYKLINNTASVYLAKLKMQCKLTVISKFFI